MEKSRNDTQFGVSWSTIAHQMPRACLSPAEYLSPESRKSGRPFFSVMLCSCTHCRADPTNTDCAHMLRRQTKTVSVTVTVVNGESINGKAYVGRCVAKLFDGAQYFGDVTKYLPPADEKGGGLWRVGYDDGNEEDMDLAETQFLIHITAYSTSRARLEDGSVRWGGHCCGGTLGSTTVLLHRQQHSSRSKP